MEVKGCEGGGLKGRKRKDGPKMKEGSKDLFPLLYVYVR